MHDEGLHSHLVFDIRKLSSFLPYNVEKLMHDGVEKSSSYIVKFMAPWTVI